MDGPMATPRAHPVRLSAAQRHRLKKLARGHKRPHRDRLRAQIVLDAAAGHAGAAIARRLGVSTDTARKWRGRFASDGFDGLRDRKRTGRPPRFTPVQQAQAKALACELPAANGVPIGYVNAFTQLRALPAGDRRVSHLDALHRGITPPHTNDTRYSSSAAARRTALLCRRTPSADALPIRLAFPPLPVEPASQVTSGDGLPMLWSYRVLPCSVRSHHLK